MEPYWSDESVTLYLGKCEQVLPGLPAESVDAIVTDPPAAISFMGRYWDGNLGGRDRWVAWLTECMAEAYRALKPGGHALVWSIPRTSHWTAWAVEDAGFDVRDCVMHLFGSGFPKNPNALKPGQEMWWLARKPFRGSVAANVLEFGTGALNIDGCRVAHASEADRAESEGKNRHADFGSGPRDNRIFGSDDRARADQGNYDGGAGRWPANIVLTHSAACQPAGTRQVRGDSRAGQDPGRRPGGFADVGAERGDERPNGALHGTETIQTWACAPDCPVGELDRQSGVLTSGNLDRSRITAANGIYGQAPSERVGRYAANSGGASRFYPPFRYQAKAPASERPRLDDGTAHETVKSLGLMSWLVRLITPPGGTVLDMFAGSGPTGEACIVEGFRCVLIEQNPKSAELIMARLSKPIQPVMFGLG